MSLALYNHNLTDNDCRRFLKANLAERPECREALVAMMCRVLRANGD